VTRQARAALLALLGAAAPLAAQPPVVPSAGFSGTLSFDARATLGEFTGSTTRLTGQITGGPGLETIRGWVQAPVDSIRTGNGLRDRDMRRVLESDVHPQIRFDLAEIRPSPMQGREMVATLAGRFTIHGVSREVTLPATLTWGPDGIRLRALLPMDVRDYGVTRLSKLLGTLRMHPDIVVRIDLLVSQLPP
jgi:polyisoprenoid-binding protein YceI